MADPSDHRPLDRSTRVEAAESHGVKGLTTLAAGVVVVAALYFGREVLIPITLAVLLSFLLAPLVTMLRRLRLGAVPAVLLSVVISVSVILTLGGVIGAQITNLANGMPRYQETIETKVQTVRELAAGRFGLFASRAGKAIHDMGLNQADGQASAPAGAASRTLHAGAAAKSGSGRPEPVPVEIREPDQSPMQLAQRILTPVVSPLETAFIVFIVAIFILLQQDDLRDRAIRLFGSHDLHRTTMAMDDAGRRLSRYFLAQLAMNSGIGILIGAGLWAIGVPSPILWGILTALLRFVPYVGLWIAALLAVALGAAVDTGWTMAAATAGLFLAIELVAGQMIEPMLYGRSTGLSPFAVVVSAIFWSWIWGPIGLILSTPMTLCLVVLGRHVDRLEFLDVLLGDRPALTPVENFYQRALSGDPDEALEQAEILLRTRSLSAYYDEIALRGLQLAASDVMRGVVTAAQLERIRAATADLVEGLAGIDDLDPETNPDPDKRGDGDAGFGPLAPPESDRPQERHPRPAGHGRPERRESPGPQRGPMATSPPALSGQASAPSPQAQGPQTQGPQTHGPQTQKPQTPPLPQADRDAHGPPRRPEPVLCISGRGPLDDVAATMLMQLLDKHGLAAQFAPYDAASRARIGQLDLSGVAIVCVFYLDLRGIPSNLRYLLRRLRQRLPGATLVAGLWPENGTDAWSADLQTAVGADLYAHSLRDMVDACVAAARTMPVAESSMRDEAGDQSVEQASDQSAAQSLDQSADGKADETMQPAG